jgi:hypothetical protein
MHPEPEVVEEVKEPEVPQPVVPVKALTAK